MKLVTITLIVFSAASAWADDRPPPIIDMHMHANGATPLSDGSPPPRLCVNDRKPCDNPPSKYQTNEALLQGTLEYMNHLNA